MQRKRGLHGRCTDTKSHKYHVKCPDFGQQCSSAQHVQTRSRMKGFQGLTATEQDEESVGSTIRLRDEPCRDAEAAGSPTPSDTLTLHSGVFPKADTTKTPRISGDLVADAGQQRLERAQQLEQQRQRRRTRRGLVISRQ